MLRSDDLIHLPYTSDLTPAGIAYACRSLPYTYNLMGSTALDRLRRITAGKSVELAFRRFLDSQAVPYDTLGATPFTEPDRYDVSLGGRRCDIKSYLVSQKNKIRLLRNRPEVILQASALVPDDQLRSDHLVDTDLFIFAFVYGLTTPRQEDARCALDARQPVYWIYPLPIHWSHPDRWMTMGPVTLKSSASQPVILEVGGQNQRREYLSEVLTLPPSKAVRTQHDFYALAFIHAPHLPQAKIGIHCPVVTREPIIITSAMWGNIWVYGLEILLTGYTTRADFRQHAHLLPAASRVFQYTRTRVDNFTLPISELQPLAGLFEQTRFWARHQR